MTPESETIPMTPIQNDTFDFLCPTRMIYRPEGLSLLGKILRDDYHFHKAVLIYGGRSLKETGRYDIAVNSLRENGIDFIDYGGISVNPDVEDVIRIVGKARAFQPDIILAIGGGSVLDTAKSVAHAYYYDGNPIDFNRKTVQPLHALPIGTVITLAASGSEMSNSCVISDRKHHFKGGFNSVTNYPLFSLIDPTLTYTVSPYQTGCGLADMFSHSMERYFSPSHTYEPCDDLALGILRSIVNVTLPVLKNPDGYEERRAMMIAGSLAHDGFTNYGKKMIFRVHQGEHKLSGSYPQLVHGQGIALLLPIYLEMNEVAFNDKLIRMGHMVFGLDKDVSAKETIQALRAWLATLPIAHSFEELGYAIDESVMQKALHCLEIKA